MPKGAPKYIQISMLVKGSIASFWEEVGDWPWRRVAGAPIRDCVDIMRINAASQVHVTASAHLPTHPLCSNHHIAPPPHLDKPSPPHLIREQKTTTSTLISGGKPWQACGSDRAAWYRCTGEYRCNQHHHYNAYTECIIQLLYSLGDSHRPPYRQKSGT